MLWGLLNADTCTMHVFALKLPSVINTRIKRGILKPGTPQTCQELFRGHA